MVGQHERLAKPLSVTSGQRWLLVVLLILALGGLGGGLAAALSSSQLADRGCVAVNIPSTMGGEELRQCGGAARSWCASFASSDAGQPTLAPLVRSACRRAGY